MNFESFGKVDGIEREVGLCVIDLIQVLPKSGGKYSLNEKIIEYFVS